MGSLNCLPRLANRSACTVMEVVVMVEVVLAAQVVEVEVATVVTGTVVGMVEAVKASKR